MAEDRVPWKSLDDHIDSVISPGIGASPEPDIAQLPDAEGRLLRGDELPIPGVHYVEWEGKDWNVLHLALLTEDEHVFREVEVTAEYVRRYDVRDRELTPQGKLVDADPGHRLARAAEYARWRYRGYLAGEVNSL